MAKHQKKHEQGAGAELIGNPDSLINLILKNKKEQASALNQVVNEGPKHKQVYSALLLQRMYELVLSVEKQTGKTFTTQKGEMLTSHKDEIEIPVSLALNSLHEQKKDAIAEAVSHSPAHEIVAFNTLLQAIEWSIIALSKS